MYVQLTVLVIFLSSVGSLTLHLLLFHCKMAFENALEFELFVYMQSYGIPTLGITAKLQPLQWCGVSISITAIVTFVLIVLITSGVKMWY